MWFNKNLLALFKKYSGGWLLLMTEQDDESNNMITINNKGKYDDYFKTLFHSYYSPLCNYARKFTGSHATAEDLVQNLFLQIYEKNVLFDISNPERFLIRSLKYKCIDYLRRNTKNRPVALDEITDESFHPLSDLTEEDIEPLLHYFAARLPGKTREVFLLSRNSNMSYKEISERLNISVKTVEAQMGRALRQLKAILKSQYLLSLFLFL